MYIKVNGKAYPCAGYDTGPGTLREARFRLTGDEHPEELGEMVELRQDDGFVLVTQTVADFARWEMEGNTLVLTDRPIPEAEPEAEPTEPEEPTPTVQEAILDELAELAYRVDSMELAAMAAGNNT